jgi:hypothetical protein
LGRQPDDNHQQRNLNVLQSIPPPAQSLQRVSTLRRPRYETR